MMGAKLALLVYIMERGVCVHEIERRVLDFTTSNGIKEIGTYKIALDLEYVPVRRGEFVEARR